ncbi:TetR/AcrR family transcriptional regulator [Nocardia sp. NBC_00565]|uniref:TetR/AcrR family transcriptional regulator n=1 Tax=Nocardia sp. NBC_00565 TaxID=2975993 RepID=UPI002E804A23|nr:helix-turn-helix domain-containing protein [Nocardia sp. NBC_00565]WUC07417.1 TetR/AcrR family transcriptional regulator [Nocardia sp. NBC_00565]
MSTRRDDILDAARDLVVREGYAGASMHAIARAAGTTRPTLYAEFGDRDELFAALIDREAERVQEMAAASTLVLPADADLAAIASDLVADAVEIYLDLVLAAPRTWRFVLMPGDGLPKPAHDRVDRGRQEIRERGQVLIAMIGAVGEADTDSELLSHAVISASEAGARIVLAEGGAERREAVAKTLRWVARRAIAAAGVGER